MDVESRLIVRRGSGRARASRDDRCARVTLAGAAGRPSCDNVWGQLIPDLVVQTLDAEFFGEMQSVVNRPLAVPDLPHGTNRPQKTPSRHERLKPVTGALNALFHSQLISF